MSGLWCSNRCRIGISLSFFFFIICNCLKVGSQLFAIGVKIMEGQEASPEQAMQMIQQRLNDLQLTLHALMSVLDEDEMIDQERINEKAQEIVENLEEQQEAGPDPQDLE